MPYEFKAPLYVKILIGGITSAIIFYKIIFSLWGEKKYKEMFYQQEFSSIVISSNSFEGSSIEFHLENDMKVYFLPPIENKIKIGDSLKKEKNSYQYRTYRKNIAGKYEYIATYDIERIQ
jgi:hypothetical protein